MPVTGCPGATEAGGSWDKEGGLWPGHPWPLFSTATRELNLPLMANKCQVRTRDRICKTRAGQEALVSRAPGHWCPWGVHSDIN